MADRDLIALVRAAVDAYERRFESVTGKYCGPIDEEMKALQSALAADQPKADERGSAEPASEEDRKVYKAIADNYLHDSAAQRSAAQRALFEAELLKHGDPTKLSGPMHEILFMFYKAGREAARESQPAGDSSEFLKGFLQASALAEAPKAAAAPEGEMVSLQSITDPENQPSQYGTVTLDYHYDDAPPGWKRTPNGWERTGEEEPMVDMVPPATSRDRWMYQEGRKAERDPRTPGTRAAMVEEMCALIKAADDAAADGDYMLDSNDCISVLRGTWKRPLANDCPKHPAQTGAALEAQEMDAITLARQFHEAYERLAPSFGYETRPETRIFDQDSANGKLMIAVCAALSAGGRK